MKLTDDLLFAANHDIMKEFVYKARLRFEVNKAIIDSHFNSNGCRIEQDNERSTKMSVEV